MIDNKTYFKRLGLGLILLTFLACCKDDDHNKTKEVDIEFSFSANILTHTVSSEFKTGDALNIFVKAEPTIAGSDFITGVKATQSGGWSISPTVLLSPTDKVYIYAVYPYNSEYTKADAIPVKINAQVDYLYSGTAPSASHASPHVSLTMKHAVNQLAFNILSDRYTGTGRLEAITISGDGFASEGILDLVSGTITATAKNSFSLACNQTITSAGWSEHIPEFFAFPMASTGDNITVTFRIDGKDEAVFLPQMTVNSGYKYIFKLAITPNGLSILNDQTEIIPLNNEGGTITIGAYGAVTIVYVGTTAELPELIGTNVSGMVYWNNTGLKENYTYPGSHTYPAPGTYQVKIDAWGADQISFNDLTNVEEVDLTSFD